MNTRVEGVVEAQDDGIRFSGPIAQKLLRANGDVQVLRTNDTLQDKEWEHFDTEIIKSVRDNLTGVADLKSRNLTYDLGGRGMAFPVMKYQEMSTAGNAYVSMTGLGRGEADIPVFDLKYFPLPIIASDWFLDFRHLMESRNMGTDLDTTMASEAGEEVAQLQEQILFNGYNSYGYGGGTIYGYTDHPDRHQGTLKASWDDSSTSGPVVLSDIEAMVDDLVQDKQLGPYIMYIPSGYQKVLARDYRDGYPETIRERILEGYGNVQDIKVSDKLSADNVVLVQMKPKTVRMVTGLDVQNIEWQEKGGLVFNYKVMTIDIPQIRSDRDSKIGLAHYTV